MTAVPRSVYPTVIQFEKLSIGTLADVMDAAQRLGLPFEAKGRSITVYVSSPQDCWNLGLEQAASRQRREKREKARRGTGQKSR